MYGIAVADELTDLLRAAREIRRIHAAGEDKPYGLPDKIWQAFGGDLGR